MQHYKIDIACKKDTYLIKLLEVYKIYTIMEIQSDMMIKVTVTDRLLEGESLVDIFNRIIACFDNKVNFTYFNMCKIEYIGDNWTDYKQVI